MKRWKKTCGTDVRHPSIPSFHRYETRQVAKAKRVTKVMEWIGPLNQLWPRFPSLNLVTEGDLSWREASGCRDVVSFSLFFIRTRCLWSSWDLQIHWLSTTIGRIRWLIWMQFDVLVCNVMCVWRGSSEYVMVCSSWSWGVRLLPYSDFHCSVAALQGKNEPVPEGSVSLDLSLKRLAEVMSAVHQLSAETHIACIIKGKAQFWEVLERWWFMRKHVERVSKDQMIEILATLKLPWKKGSLQFGFAIFDPEVTDSNFCVDVCQN